MSNLFPMLNIDGTDHDVTGDQFAVNAVDMGGSD